jgi:hypothetical protein
LAALLRDNSFPEVRRAISRNRCHRASDDVEKEDSGAGEKTGREDRGGKRVFAGLVLLGFQPLPGPDLHLLAAVGLLVPAAVWCMQE